MITIITQTYGNERRELYEIRSKDKALQYFIDQFDHNIYSFHNCSEETINFYKAKNTNKEYIEFNGITYTETIKKICNKLKKMGCNKLIFLQDDVFSYNQNLSEIDLLVNEIKTNNNIPLLNIEVKIDDFKNEIVNNVILHKSISEIDIWETTTTDFSDNGNYSFDDGPFVIDFNLIDLIFDDEFYKRGDVWSAENYNNDKFKNIRFPRFVTNKRFLKRYNIIGRNSWDRENELLRLKEKFL